MLLAVSALLVIAGCGGGSDSSTAEAPPITKAQLIKKGDAICRKTDQVQDVRMNAYQEKHPDIIASFAKAEKAVQEVGLPLIASEIQELAALGAPRGDEAQMKRIISSMESALKEAEAKPKTLLKLGEGPFHEAGDLAEKYGFKDCAELI